MHTTNNKITFFERLSRRENVPVCSFSLVELTLFYISSLLISPITSFPHTDLDVPFSQWTPASCPNPLHYRWAFIPSASYSLDIHPRMTLDSIHSHSQRLISKRTSLTAFLAIFYPWLSTQFGCSAGIVKHFVTSSNVKSAILHCKLYCKIQFVLWHLRDKLNLENEGSW